MKKLTGHLMETIKKKHFILKVLFLSVIVVFQIISCSKVNQEEQFKSKFNPSEKMPVNPLTVKPSESTKFGVLDYSTRMANGSVFITLIQKEPVKSLDNEQIILFTEGNNDCIYYDNGSETIQLWWDRKVTGIIRLLISGKEFIIDPPGQDLIWKYVKGNEEELMAYSSILQKIAAIAADFDLAFFQPYKVYTEERPLGPITITLKDLKLSAASKSEDPLCNGPIKQSDRFYAWTHVECCNLSDEDVNAKCTNSACIDCCQPPNCDWSGLLGEYMGYCESSGISCTE